MKSIGSLLRIVGVFLLTSATIFAAPPEDFSIRRGESPREYRIRIVKAMAENYVPPQDEHVSVGAQGEINLDQLLGTIKERIRSRTKKKSIPKPCMRTPTSFTGIRRT